MTPKEVFAKAAEYIEKYGWTQGTAGIRSDGNKWVDGPVCAWGALYRITAGETPDEPRDHSLRDRCSVIACAKLEAPLIVWNDDYKHRTKEDVIKLFKELAAEQP